MKTAFFANLNELGARAEEQDTWARDAWIMRAEESGPPGAQQEQEDPRGAFPR